MVVAASRVVDKLFWLLFRLDLALQRQRFCFSSQFFVYTRRYRLDSYCNLMVYLCILLRLRMTAQSEARQLPAAGATCLVVI